MTTQVEANQQEVGTPTLNRKTHKPLSNVSTPTATGTPNRNGERQSSNPLVKLVGKLVFLDLTSSYKPLSKVKQCMNLINAKLADCLSKDVDYVISNRESATNLDTSIDTPKSKTSPNALNLSSRASFINRTQSILSKASKGFTTSDILSTARRLGIKVLNISDLEPYIQKYLTKAKKLDGESTPKTKTELIRQSSFQLKSLASESRQKIYKLKNPFLKIESICKQYKPCYQEFDTWHEINLEIFTSKSTASPFQIYFSDDIKAEDNENGDDPNGSSSQNQQPSKNVFKSPTSSIMQPNQQAGQKSNVLLNCANKLPHSKSIQSGMNTVKSKISMFNNNNNNNNNSLNNTPGGGSKPVVNQFTQNKSTKRKPTGYCECCKQRFDNLKQHLTSVTHENFDRNAVNFKELDELSEGVLNFKNFLIKNKLDNFAEETKPEAERPTGIDIEETKEFAKKFNQKRQSLGISQTQVVQTLNSYQEPVYDESALVRFERLDITPRSAARMKPALERWLCDAEKLKFGDRLKSNVSVQSQQQQTPGDGDCPITKKRKRFEFPISTLEILNEAFGVSSKPSLTKLEELSKQLKEDQEEISLWFSEKRNSFKKNKKKFKVQANLLNGLLNESTSDMSGSSSLLNKSSSPDLQKNTNNKDTESKSAIADNDVRKSSALLNSVLESTSVKPKQNPYISLKHIDLNQLANNNLTPIRMNPANPNYEMSSPSAQVLFNLNSNQNSFTIPNDVSMNTSNTNNNNNSISSKLTSRLELINGTADVQSIVNDENHLHPPLTVNLSKSGGSNNSTDLSICINDSLFNAFSHDFSYDIVQKH